MRPFRVVIVALAVLGVLAVAGSAVTGASSARLGGQRPDAASALEAKKKCKRVKKRVRGKVRKVRVCKKVKKKATPAPSLPAKVSVTLDSAHAATASISAASGGSVTAGSATLTVPPGAVAATTAVTMTPVTKLGGLGGKVLGAVQFQPDGLRFLKPVTLTFPVSSTSGLKGFSYAGDGSDFHLYPVKVEAGKATLELVHFSGYGVGEQLPSPAVAKLRTQLNAVVKPAVQRAKSDAAYFEFALIRSWSFVLELASVPSGFVTLWDELQALVADIGAALRKFADDRHSKCVATHDIVGTGKDVKYALWLVFPLLVPMPRAQALLDAMTYAREQVTKCESFELDFSSDITWTAGPIPGRTQGTGSFRVRVTGLKLNAANTWSNQSPLDYWSYSPLNPPCSVSSRLFTEQPFTAQLDPVSAWYDAGSPPTISMKVMAGLAREERTITCPGSDPTVTREYLWSFGLQELHGSLAFTVDKWQYVGQSVFARRTYSGSTVSYGDTVSEQTTFTLRHTPE